MSSWVLATVPQTEHRTLTVTRSAIGAIVYPGPTTNVSAATRAIADQRGAGLDEWTGGETFTDTFILHLPRRLAGLESADPAAWGGRGTFRLAGALAAPHGLGYVEAFMRERTIDPALSRVSVPGPSEIVMMIKEPTRATLIPAAIELLRAEIHGLVEAGATWIQLDMPHVAMALTDGRMGVQAARDLVARLFETVSTGRAIHLCYGDFDARSHVQNRELAPLIPFLASLDGLVDRVLLELSLPEQWAQREMLAEVPDSIEIAAGVVDVKSLAIQSPEEIRGCLEDLLTILPPARLLVCPSCGLGRRPRSLALAKVRAMVLAARHR